MRAISFKLICLSLPLLLSACAPSGKPAAKSQPANGNEILVGVAGPMSGDLAEFGAQLRHGAEMAVADVNAAGGILGKQVRLVIGDDQCEPRRAVSVANNLVEQGVVFVDGHFCSGSSIPASAVYEVAGVLQMSPASTNPKLTQSGIGTLFRITGRDDRQGTFAGAWLAQRFAGKRVAVLDDGSAYGRQVAVETARAMEATGLPPAIRTQYSPTSGNYAALIADLAAAQVDAVYMGGYHDSIGVFVRQAREKGLNAQFLGADALNTMEFVNIAGSASDGTLFTNAAELREIPAAKPVVARFRSDGWEPEGYTLSAYAAIEVWAQAVRKAGTTDAAAVAAALRDNSWPSVIGEVDFDETGDLTSAAYTWYRFQNGTYREAGN